MRTHLEHLETHREQLLLSHASLRAEALGALAPPLLAMKRLELRLARAQRLRLRPKLLPGRLDFIPPSIALLHDLLGRR